MSLSLGWVVLRSMCSVWSNGAVFLSTVHVFQECLLNVLCVFSCCSGALIAFGLSVGGIDSHVD